MPGLPLRRRGADPKVAKRAQAELERALQIMDQAAATGNLAMLGQAFSGDALSEIRARFSAYQMAGIHVSPYRESLHLEIAPDSEAGLTQARLRYRDKTSFLCAGASPTTANDACSVLVAFDRSRDPWHVVSIVEE